MLLKHASQKERLWYQVAFAWSNLNYELAIELLAVLAELYSEDCLSVKVAEWLFYCTGQAYQAKRYLALCEKIAVHHKKNSAFLAMHSFAYELSGDCEKAYTLASRSLELDPNMAWAHHTISHIFLKQSKSVAGISFLTEVRPRIRRFLSYPSPRHLNWHLSLCYLAELNKPACLDIYTNEIWSQPDNVLKQIDAISLLWRLEMAGFPQEEKWPKILDCLQKTPYEHYVPFHNAHYVYALARANKADLAEQVVAKSSIYASQLEGINKDWWANAGVPLFRACLAFAKQDYKAAHKYIDNIIPQLLSVGGSDAQDEILWQMYYLSLLKSGEKSKAQAIRANHLKQYDPTQLGQYWLGLAEK